MKMGLPSGRRLPSVRNIGSPGPGVWYTRREPSVDQSNSAAPSRYGSGWPPRAGTPHTLMSWPADRVLLRFQYVTRDPSGENPGVRSSEIKDISCAPSSQVMKLARTHLRDPNVLCAVLVGQEGHEMTVA